MTICWIDMLDVWGKVETCANFCWSIWMEGSTGTEAIKVGGDSTCGIQFPVL